MRCKKILQIVLSIVLAISIASLIVCIKVGYIDELAHYHGEYCFMDSCEMHSDTCNKYKSASYGCQVATINFTLSVNNKNYTKLQIITSGSNGFTAFKCSDKLIWCFHDDRYIQSSLNLYGHPPGQGFTGIIILSIVCVFVLTALILVSVTRKC